MKITSTPKPVRIRITVSGQEHTTLASLKENISPEIMSFVDDVDGRLQRWLERQKEVELKDAVNRIYQDEEKSRDAKLLDLYNLLFGESKEQIAEYVDAWGDADIRSKKIVEYLVEHCNIDVLTGIVRCHYQLFSSADWKKLITPMDNSALEFELAKKFCEVGEKKKAIILFRRIKERKDCKEAMDFYNQHCKWSDFFPNNSPEDLRSIVQDLSQYKKLEPTNELEHNVKSFIEACYKIIYVEDNGGNFRKSKLCESLFPSCLNKGDILYDEKFHVRAVVFYCYGHYRLGAANTALFRKQKLEISTKYKFYHKVCMFSSPEVCKNAISEIINYILFEKFIK